MAMELPPFSRCLRRRPKAKAVSRFDEDIETRAQMVLHTAADPPATDSSHEENPGSSIESTPSTEAPNSEASSSSSSEPSGNAPNNGQSSQSADGSTGPNSPDGSASNSSSATSAASTSASVNDDHSNGSDSSNDTNGGWSPRANTHAYPCILAIVSILLTIS